MIEAKQVHCGQYKRYGDFFRVWDIETDVNKQDALEHSALTPEQLTQHMKDTAKAAGLVDMLKCMKGW